ncbi:uncharacterized protein METZ01_LOCUS111946 [marine metagenome]|uniref:Uncharacterized protein n=1 Tax=marine metagenome TaxID=408172 RepID=A0A381X3B5_9ZZZZ
MKQEPFMDQFWNALREEVIKNGWISICMATS